jgi:16S rRNA C967 or C1407 C5-methylase (RsmB/RsmF family)
LKRHPRHYSICYQIIKNYGGDLPFPLYFQNVSRNNKSWGSKDRRSYRELSYLYLKNIEYFKGLNTEIEYIRTWQQIEVGELPHSAAYSRFESHISTKINTEHLNKWFHSTGPVFVHALIPEKLKDFPLWNEAKPTNYGNVKLLPANSPIQPWIDKGWAYIQDISSFQIISENIEYFTDKRVWDACSGAGGKALSIARIGQPKELICTDIRENILENLRKRFKNSPYHTPQCFILDIGLDALNDQVKKSQVIFADVPCSGSGTWRRSPEQLNAFSSDSLGKYTTKQAIILNRLLGIKTANTIIYCTCSVFKEENEDLVRSVLIENKEYVIAKESYLGTDQNTEGDYLYYAVLQRPL